LYEILVLILLILMVLLYPISYNGRWYRLFATKLYYVKFTPEELSCSMEVVADITGCTVSAKPGDMPFLFSVTPAAPKGASEIDFQAENEDEMVLWITAIRRCSVSAPGRPLQHLIGDSDGGSVRGRDAASTNATTAAGDNPPPPEASALADVEAGSAAGADPGPERGSNDSEVVRLRISRNNVAVVNAWRNPDAEQKLLEFLQQNDYCAECGTHEHLKWISTSLGITLCEACAGAHRQLTWSVSKLKNIEFDEFPEWQVTMLRDELGNGKVNTIWEMNVPEGWTKPEPDSPIEAKLSWVLAKYMWYGFVEELRIRSQEQLCEGLFEAVRSGSVADVMWWLSLKAEINGTLPARHGAATPMHIAVGSARQNTVAYLALVSLSTSVILYYTCYYTILVCILLCILLLYYYYIHYSLIVSV
jgi:hypothetical protein